MPDALKPTLLNSFGDYLEPEYAPSFKAWKASPPSPATNTALLTTLQPIVDKGLARFGDGSPLSRSKARLMTLEAMGSYDPSRAKLESHLMNHLQGLQRVVRQNNEVIRAPERVVLERQRLRSYEQELADELGQTPTDDQIADRYGIPPKRLKQIRSFHPGMTEGQLYAIDPESDVAAKLPGQDNSEHWVQLVHSELGEMDQRILELSLGLNGHRKLNNLEIARQLGRTPGAITQRKAKIQQLLDREQLLSPFIPRG